MNQSIAFIVHLPGKPERRAELESRLLDVLEQMSKEPDFINTYLHRSLEDPDTLVLYENWGLQRAAFQGPPPESVLPARIRGGAGRSAESTTHAGVSDASARLPESRQLKRYCPIRQLPVPTPRRAP